MNKISKIINLKKHPINDLIKFSTICKKEIQNNSILVLKNFLNFSALENLQIEAKEIAPKKLFIVLRNIQYY